MTNAEKRQLADQLCGVLTAIDRYAPDADVAAAREVTLQELADRLDAMSEQVNAVVEAKLAEQGASDREIWDCRGDIWYDAIEQIQERSRRNGFGGSWKKALHDPENREFQRKLRIVAEYMEDERPDSEAIIMVRKFFARGQAR